MLSCINNKTGERVSYENIENPLYSLHEMELVCPISNLPVKPKKGHLKKLNTVGGVRLINIRPHFYYVGGEPTFKSSNLSFDADYHDRQNCINPETGEFEFKRQRGAGGQSATHITGKEEIKKAILTEVPEAIVELEYILQLPNGKKRIADVFVTLPNGLKEVVEYQVSRITLEELKKRTEDYYSLGFSVQWVFSESAKTKEISDWIRFQIGQENSLISQTHYCSGSFWWSAYEINYRKFSHVTWCIYKGIENKTWSENEVLNSLTSVTGIDFNGVDIYQIDWTWVTLQDVLFTLKRLQNSEMYKLSKHNLKLLTHQKNQTLKYEGSTLHLAAQFDSVSKATQVTQAIRLLPKVMESSTPTSELPNVGDSVSDQVQEYPVPEPSIINPDSDDYGNVIDKIKSANKLVLDLETFCPNKTNSGGLNPWFNAIRLIQIGVNGEIFIFDLGAREEAQMSLFSIGAESRDVKWKKHQALFNALKDRIESKDCQVIGHNIIFDLTTLAIKIGAKNPKNVSDTMIGAKVALGYYGKSDKAPKSSKPMFRFSLGHCVKRFVGVVIDKSQQDSDWGDSMLSEAQLKYASADVFWTEILHEKLTDFVSGKTKTKFWYEGAVALWQLENDAIIPAITMTLNGIPYDGNIAREQMRYLEQIESELLKQWHDICPEFNPTQKQELKKYVAEKYGIHVDKFDKEQLADYSDNELISLSLKLSALAGYVNNLKAFQRSAEALVDGRIHTSYSTLTGTGRFSSGGGSGKNKIEEFPNLHAIKAKESRVLSEYNVPSVRQIVSPGKSKKLIVADLAASHARIASEFCDDAMAIKLMNDDSIDSHSQVAAFVTRASGLDLDWQTISKLNGKWHYQNGEEKLDVVAHPHTKAAKSARGVAKNTFYGWLNGAGAKRTQSTIKGQSGREPKLEDCEAALEGCRNLCPDIEPNRKRFLNSIKAFVFDTETDLGTIKVAPVPVPAVDAQILFEAKPSFYNENEWQAPYTQALACIWSRTEATIMKRIIIAIDNLIKSKWHEWDGVMLINYVHDEVNLEAPEELALEVATAVREIVDTEWCKVIHKVSSGVESDPAKYICSDWSEK